MNTAKLIQELDGLKDGDGHFEVVGTGPAAKLSYRLDPPYNSAFTFVESLAEISLKISGDYVDNAREAGVTPIGLFAVHTWESALTAKEGETLMRLTESGVDTFRAD